MSVPVQPLAEYVVVQIEVAPTKTASGIFIPQSAAEKPKTAKVLAVGKDVVDVKVGDRILYKNDYEATDVKVAGESYVVVFHKNIIATVK